MTQRGSKDADDRANNPGETVYEAVSQSGGDAAGISNGVIPASELGTLLPPSVRDFTRDLTTSAYYHEAKVSEVLGHYTGASGNSLLIAIADLGGQPKLYRNFLSGGGLRQSSNGNSFGLRFRQASLQGSANYGLLLGQGSPASPGQPSGVFGMAQLSNPIQFSLESQSSPQASPQFSPQQSSPQFSPQASPQFSPQQSSPQFSPQQSSPQFSPQASPQFSQVSPQFSPQFSPQASPQFSPQASPQASPQFSPQQSSPQFSPQASPQFSLQQSSPQASPQFSPQASPQFSPQASPQFSPQASPQFSPQQSSPQFSPQFSQVSPQYSPQASPQFSPQQSSPQASPQFSPQASPQFSPQASPQFSPQQSSPQFSLQSSPQFSPQASPQFSPQQSSPQFSAQQSSPQFSPQASPAQGSQVSVLFSQSPQRKRSGVLRTGQASMTANQVSQLLQRSGVDLQQLSRVSQQSPFSLSESTGLDGSFVRPFGLDTEHDVAGWELYDTRTRIGTMLLGVNDRLGILIEGTNLDANVLSEVALALDFGQMERLVNSQSK